MPRSEIVRHCRAIIEKTNFGKRGEFDGDFYQQLFGLIAETIVCDWLGLPWPENKNGFDGGFDLTWKGKKWDVKCEIRTKRFIKKTFVHNLVGNQKNYVSEGLIFVSFNRPKGEYEICGYVEKDKFFKNAVFTRQGQRRVRSDGSFFTVQASGGLFEISQKFLTEFKIEDRQ